MGGLGGIGAFAGGFAKSFAASREQRRLRDLDLMREQQRADHEQRMQQQFDTQQKFREDQQAAVEKYRAGQAELQQKQLLLQQKRLDVDVAGGLAKAFDPKIAKPQRVFMLKQMMKTLDIDPKSQQAKDFMQMATSLDDEALKETRSSLMTLLPDATPGEVTAFTKSIVNGDLQMKDALEAFDKSRKAKQLDKIMSGGGGGGGVPTAKVQTSRITDPTAMAQQPGMGMQQPGGNLPIPGMEQPGSIPPQATSGGLTGQQLRDRATELAKAGFHTEAATMAQLARDTEAGNNPQLKQIVGPDGKDMWVTEKQALGKEAPSGRPVLGPEEQRLVEAGKESVKQDYARVKPWLDDASTAKQTAPLIQAFKTANASGKFVSGSFSGLRENITKVAELVGMDPAKIQEMTGIDIGNPAIAETLKSTSAQLGTLIAERLGRATNMQVQYIQDALPNLMKTPRGNEIAVNLLENANERSIQIERLYDEYQDKYGGDLRPHGKPSFFQEADRIRRQPLVSEELQKEIKQEAKKGAAVDINKLWDKAQTAADEVLTIGKEKFGITGQYELKDEKGKPAGKLPMVQITNGQSYPLAKTRADVEKIPSGESFLWEVETDDPNVPGAKIRQLSLLPKK